MTFKKPDWEKQYDLKNCEVTGYCKLSNLTPNKFGAKNYELKVLVDKKIGETIKKEIEKAIKTTAEDYGKDKAAFKRITNIKKLEKDKKTGKVINTEYYPEDKLMIDLRTNSFDGNWIVPVCDGKREDVENPKLGEGSIVNVVFTASTYCTSTAGVSVKLNYVQIVKAVANSPKNPVIDNPFEELEDCEDLQDEFVNPDDEEEYEEI